MRRLVFALLVGALFVPNVSLAKALPLSIRDLSDRADLIVRASVLSIAPAGSAGATKGPEIVTLEILETIAGKARKGGDVQVIGGVKGCPEDPDYRVRRQALVFLQSDEQEGFFRTVGMSQGAVFTDEPAYAAFLRRTREYLAMPRPLSGAVEEDWLVSVAEERVLLAHAMIDLGNVGLQRLSPSLVRRLSKVIESWERPRNWPEADFIGVLLRHRDQRAIAFMRKLIPVARREAELEVGRNAHGPCDDSHLEGLLRSLEGSAVRAGRCYDGQCPPLGERVAALSAFLDDLENGMELPACD